MSKPNTVELFNLPDLQKAAFERFGYTVNETLESALKLYNNLRITYPYTDGKKLPPEYTSTVRELLAERCQITGGEVNEGSIKALLSEPLASTHPAIIPTPIPDRAKNATPFTEMETNIYELICERFAEVFVVNENPVNRSALKM